MVVLTFGCIEFHVLQRFETALDFKILKDTEVLGMSVFEKK